MKCLNVLALGPVEASCLLGVPGFSALCRMIQFGLSSTAVQSGGTCLVRLVPKHGSGNRLQKAAGARASLRTGLLASLLGARKLLGAKGIATRSKKLRTGLLALLLSVLGARTLLGAVLHAKHALRVGDRREEERKGRKTRGPTNNKRKGKRNIRKVCF